MFLGYMFFEIHGFVENAGDGNEFLFGTVKNNVMAGFEYTAADGEIITRFAPDGKWVRDQLGECLIEQTQVNGNLILAPFLNGVEENREQVFVGEVG